MVMASPSSDQKPRLVFMGTPPFAVPSLRRLAEEYDIAAVYSQPPRRQGRGMKEQPSAVHQAALDLGLDVRCPLRFDEAAIDALSALNPDFLIVVAYGLILPQAVLDIPRQAPINGHASILPRWRGAAPIHRAIEAGDAETGVTAMMMQAGLDTGPMLKTITTPINDDDTTGRLHDRLALICANVLAETVAGYEGLVAEPQDDALVTWADKITPAEAEINFDQAVADIDRKHRAFAPFPGSWVSLGLDEQGRHQRLKVKAMTVSQDPADAPPGQVLGKGSGGGPLIAAADGAVEFTTLQPAGKPAMSGRDYLNGYALPWRIYRSDAADDAEMQGGDDASV